MSGVDARRARRWLARLRVLVYLLLTLLVAYHAWRYDLVQLPAEGCSPLREFAPGTRLIVDRRGPTPIPGDAVLYRAPEGLLLGRVEAAPDSQGDAVVEACAQGRAFWIRKDQGACPGSDSLVFGALAAERLEGRVAGTVPW